MLRIAVFSGVLHGMESIFCYALSSLAHTFFGSSFIAVFLWLRYTVLLSRVFLAALIYGRSVG